MQMVMALICNVNWKVQWYGQATGEKQKDYVVHTVKDLNMKEWESLIDLLLEFRGSTEEYQGELLPELALAAVNDGNTDACVFVSRYGKTLRVERMAVKVYEAGEALWQTLKEKVQTYLENFTTE